MLQRVYGQVRRYLQIFPYLAGYLIWVGFRLLYVILDGNIEYLKNHKFHRGWWGIARSLDRLPKEILFEVSLNSRTFTF